LIDVVVVAPARFKTGLADAARRIGTRVNRLFIEHGAPAVTAG
jgi:hypothetical protein